MTLERERRIRSQAAAKHDREDSRLYYESTQVLLAEIDALRQRLDSYICRVEQDLEPKLEASDKAYEQEAAVAESQQERIAELEKELAEAKAKLEIEAIGHGEALGQNRRLREELAESGKRVDHWADKAHTVERRVERLREALCHVANLCHTAAIQHKCESCNGHALIAEAALADEPANEFPTSASNNNL